MKLCTDRAKLFVGNTQNCGKTNIGFCIIISHQLTHRCLCVSFWPKTKPQLLNSPDLEPDDFFPLPKLKIPMKGKRFVTIEEIKDKTKQELLAIPKTALQKCFENWEKRWHKCILSEGNYFERNLWNSINRKWSNMGEIVNYLISTCYMF